MTKKISKTISWQLISTVVSFIISYLLCDEIGLAINLTIVGLFIKGIIFYIHETMWEKV